MMEMWLHDDQTCFTVEDDHVKNYLYQETKNEVDAVDTTSSSASPKNDYNSYDLPFLHHTYQHAWMPEPQSTVKPPRNNPSCGRK